MRMNWVVSNAERFLRRSNQKQLYLSAHFKLSFSMQKTDSKEKFKDLDTCLMCDKPKLTLQNPLGPPMVVLRKVPVALPVITPPHCHPFLTWISFPKASYYYFYYYIKGLAQLRQVPEQCEVWEHQTRLSLFPSSGMKAPPPSSVSLPLSQTIFLFYCTNHFRRTDRKSVV